MASRAGSHAGRGFRYQDAVAASLAVGGWAGQLPYGLVVPEGDDDIELGTTTGRVLAQVKSRRSKRGGFPVADVVNRSLAHRVRTTTAEFRLAMDAI